MAYWWVNHKQTREHEVRGGYLWSPIRNQNGAHNQSYDKRQASLDHPGARNGHEIDINELHQQRQNHVGRATGARVHVGQRNR